MPRFFNTAGPCGPDDHYMLPPERRLEGIRECIDRKMYFVVHAPRQVGKTTSYSACARRLTEEGHYLALHASLETAQPFGDDVEEGIEAVIEGIHAAARGQLSEILRPPRGDRAVAAGGRVQDLLERWCQSAPRPVVLFLDEIDALTNGTLISVLRQLRAGYPGRPARFPQSIALIGLRDVRDYGARMRPDSDSLGTASPFNIKVESLTLRNFTSDEIAELYAQHTHETGQAFSEEATRAAWELTRGQPWLTNALARQIVDKDLRDRTATITAEHMNAAAEALILRRDTHLDSLIEKLREERVRRVLEPILAGELIPAESLADDIAYVQDLGLVSRGPSGLEIANAIYREVIPRALSWVVEETLPIARADFVAPDGRLLFRKMLESFRDFWLEHAEFFLRGQPYPEAAPHLILMAYLQRVVNAGGTIEREYAVGRGRMDLHVRWPWPGGLQEEALELKVWREGRPDPERQGLEQITGYLGRLGLARGVLVLFDRRSSAPPLPERVSIVDRQHEGRTITILRL